MVRRLSAGIRVLVALAFGCLSLADTARAQERPKFEIGGAYQAVVDASLAQSGMRRETGAQGWSLDVAFPIARRLSLVGAVDGSYGQETEIITSFGGGTLDSSWTDIAYHAGVRFHPSSPSRVRPFVHVLAGVVRADQREEYKGIPSLGTYEFTTSVFLLSVGAGVNVMFTPRLGVRVGGDVRIDPIGSALQGDDTTMARVLAGVVFTIP